MPSKFRTMMKIFVLVLLSVVVVVTAQEKYTTKYDDIDLDAILNNERLLKQYHECLMDRGKCTKEGEELKKVIRDALERGCDLCSEKQKEGAHKVFKVLFEKYRSNFDELKAKYDPEGKYITKYHDIAVEHGYKP